MGLEVGGLIGLIILIADVYAIVKTIQSGASTGAKVLWVASHPGPAGGRTPSLAPHGPARVVRGVTPQGIGMRCSAALFAFSRLW